MAHALAAFIQERMLAKKWRQRDVVAASGLSRALVSKYAADDREKLTRLPERETLEGFAKALGVPIDVLIGKAVEALDLGYTSGDFINSVATAHYRDLLDEIGRRLDEGGGAHAGSAAPNTPPDVSPAPERHLAVASGGAGGEDLARQAAKQAAEARAEAQAAIKEMKDKKSKRDTPSE